MAQRLGQDGPLCSHSLLWLVAQDADPAGCLALLGHLGSF